MTFNSSDRRVPTRLRPSQNVGYGNPPPEHRFKQGVSGNPNGRPRKRHPVEAAPFTSVTDILLEEAYRPITIRENNEEVRIPMIQAVMRSMGVAAVKGNHRAQLAITGLVSAAEQELSNLKALLYTNAMDYKRHWEREFQNCDREGRVRPEPFPHPHEIRLVPETGEVIFNGPIDEAGHVSWNRLLEMREHALGEVERMEKYWRHSTREREFVTHMIEQEQLIADAISAVVPDEATRRAPDFDIHAWRRERRKPVGKLVRQVLERRTATISIWKKPRKPA